MLHVTVCVHCIVVYLYMFQLSGTLLGLIQLMRRGMVLIRMHLFSLCGPSNNFIIQATLKILMMTMMTMMIMVSL